MAEQELKMAPFNYYVNWYFESFLSSFSHINDLPVSFSTSRACNFILCEYEKKAELNLRYKKGK